MAKDFLEFSKHIEDNPVRRVRIENYKEIIRANTAPLRPAPESYRFPTLHIRLHEFADEYFVLAQKIRMAEDAHGQFLLDLFQKQRDVTFAGSHHVSALLAASVGHYRDYKKAEVLSAELFGKQEELESALSSSNRYMLEAAHALVEDISRLRLQLEDEWDSAIDRIKVWSVPEGSILDNREPAYRVEGDYIDFGCLETLMLGIFSDAAMVATNMRKCVEAANGLPIILFGARHKSFEGSASDGYAAMVGGCSSVSTDEQGRQWGIKGTGTIPHALIACYEGSIQTAARKFDQYINNNGTETNAPVIALTDFKNDNVTDAVATFLSLGDRLYGVRLDTSENMIDKTIQHMIDLGLPIEDGRMTGVNITLVREVRKALDEVGGQKVKIVCSGGFTPEKIKYFTEKGAPVDAYGVGSYAYHGAGGEYDFTADIVRVNGKNFAKVGRSFRENPRLQEVDLKQYLPDRMVGLEGV